MGLIVYLFWRAITPTYCIFFLPLRNLLSLYSLRFSIHHLDELIDIPSSTTFGYLCWLESLIHFYRIPFPSFFF